MTKIEELVEKRRQLWSQGMPAADVEAALEGLWEEARKERAEMAHGPTARIMASARIERELEKLMTQDDSEVESPTDDGVPTPEVV